MEDGKEERGPAYLIPERVPDPSQALVITKDSSHLLRHTFPWVEEILAAGTDIGPVVGVVEEERAVSISYCARLGHFAAEAGVETMLPLRGKGYPTKAVAGWAHAVRKRNILPLYSTSWNNAASLRIADKLGMELYGEDWWIE